MKTVKLELDKTVVEEEFAQEYIETNMTGVSSGLQREMSPFGCTYQKCNFVTPAGKPHWYLLLHLMDDHGWKEEEAEEYIFEKERPVFPRGCGVKQFNSFRLDWDRFSEQYGVALFMSRKELEGEFMYKLNFQLLACLPEPLKNKIFKAIPLAAKTIRKSHLH